MPELDKSWAYPASLIFMAVIMLGMILFFRKKKWL
jgi:Mg2+ and Co2+ transporter CorA